MTTNEVDLEAIAVLQANQLWRRGGDGPATDPTELGKAIDSVISELTASRARDAEAAALVASWRKYAVDVGGKDLTDEAIAATANSCADDLAAIIGIKNGCHESDCAVHNAPAYPTGPCDCVLTTGAKL